MAPRPPGRTPGRAALALWLALAAAPLQAESEERAAMLYDNHCTGCHTSAVHIRERNKARSLPQVEEWVRYWSLAQGLGWSEADVAAVVRLLNDRHYHY